MAEIETNLLNQSRIKPIAWKHDIKTHYKPTETNTHYTSCYPQGVKRGFIKGEAISLELSRTNSSETPHFQEAISNFKRDFK